jgi:hypothetical protein
MIYSVELAKLNSKLDIGLFSTEGPSALLTLTERRSLFILISLRMYMPVYVCVCICIYVCMCVCK